MAHAAAENGEDDPCVEYGQTPMQRFSGTGYVRQLGSYFPETVATSQAR